MRRAGASPAAQRASACFTLAVIAFIAGAIWLSADWPAAAKPVPLTACYIALIAAALNLINEPFGDPEKVAAAARAPDGRRRGASPEPADARSALLAALARAVTSEAATYFYWLLAFLLMIWLIGFLPAIAIFVFAYMCLGFGEPAAQSIGFAAATALLCYGLFHPRPGGRLAGLVARRSGAGAACVARVRQPRDLIYRVATRGGAWRLGRSTHDRPL